MLISNEYIFLNDSMKGLPAPLAYFSGSDEMALTVSFLENLTKVPRFDTLIMFLSSKDKDDLAKTWDEVFYYEVIPIEFAEKLDNLRTKYCLK
ncbi:putative RNA-polymerase II-associated protein [Rosa chinensis]|uniref:Putative RNA-polymerase II-associated protein n=1 Tax=Rosa chinensis TaxID=74649 RepID=A0A2P6R7L0_ROSCH|nr:putative RNA-polymerase II-associated protein [Rosa chinensis]